MYVPRGEPVVFERDCEAVVIPAGDSGTIPAGAEGVLTQALGGSYTVFLQGHLFRIDGTNADAIGKEPPTPPQLPEGASDADVEQIIWEQMATCYDPEIPVNVVDLGLIYRCDITKDGEGYRHVDIDMTLTAPGCGMGDILAHDIRVKVEMVPTVATTSVQLVFSPPWSQERMSEAAKLQVGLL
ncbi:putative Fe-S cluster assembly protein SufT [Halorhodospira abdelmalekii]|uniref:putative Fe-S cluster assembly protein SufT n=1 Tax=Halorhodospira abdelmalekii TaxID=421629 RepID=UPI001904A071|nr:putative Fe-S cluster assembly protein SufT [Halorhodospira abdelmalekii]MBK1733874.1 putative Fe-S cluster assembly protein SufT [Halorhodospira abdelmalekii]